MPYKGGSQSVASVVSGETQWTLTPAPAAMGLVQGGRLRLLGHSMARGTQPLGPVPAIGEVLAGFEFASWIGLLAPRGLPPAVADLLRRQLAAALALPVLKEAFAVHGAVPAATAGEAFLEFVARDIDTNRRAIRLAGLGRSLHLLRRLWPRTTLRILSALRRTTPARPSHLSAELDQRDGHLRERVATATAIPGRSGSCAPPGVRPPPAGGKAGGVHHL